jgi:prevent-host-death family protein
MREIGVRELKASLSEVLRLAARGEHIRVTVRGRAIADIVAPAADPEEDRLRSLTAAGRLTPAVRSRPRAAPRLVPTSRPASTLVLDDREAGR